MVAKKIEIRQRRSTIDSHYHSGSSGSLRGWYGGSVKRAFWVKSSLVRQLEAQLNNCVA